LLLLQTLLHQQNPEESSAKRFQTFARHVLGILVEHGQVGEWQFDHGLPRSVGEDQEKLGRTVHRLSQDVLESQRCQSSVETQIETNSRNWSHVSYTDLFTFVAHLTKKIDNKFLICVRGEIQTYVSVNCIKLKAYRWTSLYEIDRDQKIRLAYNEFAYKKIKNDRKLGDTFQKNGQFAIADMTICR
jgi:hypothetical protein